MKWLIDLVSEFGIEALPHDQKTEEVLHVLYESRFKINARQELKVRQQNSQLTSKRLHYLVYESSEDLKKADVAEAFFIQEETRSERQ